MLLEALADEDKRVRRRKRRRRRGVLCVIDIDDGENGGTLPFTGWVGTRMRCEHCRAERPIVNAPFVDVPITIADAAAVAIHADGSVRLESGIQVSKLLLAQRVRLESFCLLVHLTSRQNFPTNQSINQSIRRSLSRSRSTGWSVRVAR